MVRVTLDAFVDVQLRLPRLAPLPRLDGSLTGWPNQALQPDLTGLHNQSAFARVWGGWSVDGLALAFDVQVGHALHIQAQRPFQSDGVEIWCDTRDSRAARKPTRFCHHFIVLPGGRGQLGADGGATGRALARHHPRHDPPTRQTAPPEGLPLVLEMNPGGVKKPGDMADLSRIQAAAHIRPGEGYTLEVFLPREVLSGYAPLESTSIALGYRIRDTGMGLQDLAFGEQFPIWRNPSLWRSARLEGA